VEAEERAGVEVNRVFIPEAILPAQVLHPPAESWLQRIGQETGAPRPDIIVLAGTGSQNSKHEVITALRKDPQLKSIPVVVLTLGPPVAGS